MTKNRVATGAVLAAVLFGIIAIIAVILMQSDTYKVLFTDMTGRQVTVVTEALAKKGIDYRIDEKEGTILVPTAEADRARMHIMTEGVLSNASVGFEIFDNSEFGMTEFSQKVNYKRALEGELSRTISSLDEIKYARVHIVQPSSRLFVREGEKASASITLFVKQHAELTERQINGIQNIVASSVNGLDMSNVMVSNQVGEILSNNNDADNKKDVHKLTRKESLEQYYSSKISRILDSSIGKNNYVVSVDLEFDYTRLSQTTENYISGDDGKVVTRQRTSKNKNGDMVSSDYEYKYGKEIKNIEQEMGRVQKINIGVIVPDTTSAEQMEKLKDIIEMAAGVDRGRGDMVTIHGTGLVNKKKSVTLPASLPNQMESANATEPAVQKTVKHYLGVLTGVARRVGLTDMQLAYFIVAVLVFSLLINMYYLILRRSPSRHVSSVDKQEVLDEIKVWFERGNRHVS